MVAGRLVTVEPGGGRVGGLLNPPVAAAVRVEELARGFVPAVLAAVATPRRAAVVDEIGTRLVALELAGDLAVEGDFAAEGDLAVTGVFAATGDFATLVVAAGWGAAAGAGASSRWTASDVSTSDMLGNADSPECRSLGSWSRRL